MSRSAIFFLMHLLGCLLFLALPYFFAENPVVKLAQLPTNAHERRNLASYLLTIAFFYTNYYILIPRLFFPRRYVRYGLSVWGCFLLVQTTLTLILHSGEGAPPRRDVPGRTFSGAPPDGRRPPPPFDEDRPPPPMNAPSSGPPTGDAIGLPPEILQTLLLFLAGLLLSLAIRINNRWRETERERLHTELLYLKAQINPHFLFNTLNSIYSLAIEQAPTTADAIVQLSSLLRYVITEGRNERVALSQELAHIGHYVALQRLRIPETVEVVYQMTGNASGCQIAPLLLISFVENAFKYGVSPQEPSRIEIEFSVADGQLNGRVFNRKVRVSDATAASSGIGLSNTKARLTLQYPGRHEVMIRDEADSFTIDLRIDLN